MKKKDLTATRRSKIRKENRGRKDYFREYYSGERYERQKEAVQRDCVMKREAGYLDGKHKETYRQKRKALMGRKIIIFVDGQKLVGWQYALKNLVKNISQGTIKSYLRNGYIPPPPYKAKALNGYRKYYSMYQIRLINLCWSKSKNKKPLKERVERLHEKWKHDPLLGGNGNDRDTD